jgi:ribonuclease-3
MVKRETLAKIGRKIGLSDYLIMGSGEIRAGGQSRDSTLADAVEAILCAVYLDQGMDACESAYDLLFNAHFEALDLNRSVKDPKTRLQEHLQSRNYALPEYAVTGTSGKQHNQRFFVDCTIADLDVRTSGEGTSRRKAEQDAASRALQQIGVENG